MDLAPARAALFYSVSMYPEQHTTLNTHRSKQNVRDKDGPLEDNAGNIITQGFLMAEELNMHFSSVFTRENTSSIPVPEAKFKGSEGEMLGQVVVTPEVVANKINNMKENKSPGVDGSSYHVVEVSPQMHQVKR